MSDADYIAKFKANCIITEKGCWEWQGFCVPFRNMKPGQRGYPSASYRGKRWKLNRLMVTITQRPMLPSEVAMHTCDNPPCINPAHLKPGTMAENMQDASKKKRADRQWMTHCKRGHELTGDNVELFSENGGKTFKRKCKACQRGRMRIAAGWPAEMAFTVAAVPHGHRPVMAKWPRKVA